MRSSFSALRGHRRLAIGAAAIGGLLLLLGAQARWRAEDAGRVPVARVVRDDLVIDVASVGELQAVHSLSFEVPRLRGSAAKVVWLVPEGSTVAAGDTLARLDPSEVLRRIEDVEARLVSARANLEKLHATQTARIHEMEAALQDQRASVRLAEIGAANLEYEPEVERERGRLELERARLAVEQAESKLAAQRSIDEAELTEQRLSIAQLESQLAAERDTQKSHVIVAPTSGLVVYGARWSGGRRTKVKVGDELYYGGEVLELPDLTQVQAECWVNEARVDVLRAGLPCAIHIDAFPDTVYRGTVTRINVIGRELPESEGVKVFDFVAGIDGSDPRLRPGMTATVVVHVAKLDSVVVAPIEAVHADDSGSWVYRKHGRRFEKVPVVLGRRNDFHVVLVSGVGVGDELALRAPKGEDGGGE